MLRRSRYRSESGMKRGILAWVEPVGAEEKDNGERSD